MLTLFLLWSIIAIIIIQVIIIEIVDIFDIIVIFVVEVLILVGHLEIVFDGVWNDVHDLLDGVADQVDAGLLFVSLLWIVLFVFILSEILEESKETLDLLLSLDCSSLLRLLVPLDLLD